MSISTEKSQWHSPASLYASQTREYFDIHWLFQPLVRDYKKKSRVLIIGTTEICVKRKFRPRTKDNASHHLPRWICNLGTKNARFRRPHHGYPHSLWWHKACLPWHFKAYVIQSTVMWPFKKLKHNSYSIVWGTTLENFPFMHRIIS